MPRAFGSIGRATNDICTPCNYPAIMVVRESVTALGTGHWALRSTAALPIGHCPSSVYSSSQHSSCLACSFPCIDTTRQAVLYKVMFSYTTFISYGTKKKSRQRIREYKWSKKHGGALELNDRRQVTNTRMHKGHSRHFSKSWLLCSI